MTTLKKSNKLDLVDIDGIQFLTKISNKFAESIRGGYTFTSYDVNDELYTSGSIGSIGSASTIKIDSDVHTVHLRSDQDGGGFDIIVPGGDNFRLYPDAGMYYVTFGAEVFGTIAGTEVEMTVVDRGAPSTPTFDGADFSIPATGSSGAAPAASSSLTFFPSS